MNNIPSNFKSAFIAFVGRPNSGKSTLLNTILGEGLSIVTSMPQTTQRNIRGIYNREGYQLVFVDTPGFYRGKHALNKAMLKQSKKIFSDKGIDLLCYLVDLSRSFGKEEDEIAKVVESLKIPVCIVFNKTDLCSSVDEKIYSFFSRYPGLATLQYLSICANSESAQDKFLDAIKPSIPDGPQYYPKEDISDLNMRFFSAEYIRKQIIDLTHEEVPHAVFVEIIDYKEFENKHEVNATIHVETQGQKGIVIGKKGRIINQIKKQAALELSDLAGVPVTITCHVKVTAKWRDNQQFLAEMGLDVK